MISNNNCIIHTYISTKSSQRTKVILMICNKNIISIFVKNTLYNSDYTAEIG